MTCASGSRVLLQEDVHRWNPRGYGPETVLHMSVVVSMSEASADRAVVKVYVPEALKDDWVEHADDLDMSQSEFVRTMVQAGRRDFDVEPYPERTSPTPSSAAQDASDRGEDGTDQSTRSLGREFESRIVSLLESEPRSWDDLLAALTDDVEERLEEALESLQAENRVRYSGRQGGYEAVSE